MRRAVNHWLADGKAQGWSPKTILDRRQTLERFIWWVENEAEAAPQLGVLSPALVREFLSYAREPRPEGRYGSDRPSAKREARPATVNAYFRALRAFSNFCLAEGLLDDTPLRNVKAPRIPKDQIVPFTPEQVQALLDTARRTKTPERDAAIVFLLCDTGMRVSELCGLTVGAVDRGSGEITVTGKGNKKRQVHMGQRARRALWRYLEADRRQAAADEPLIVAEGGHHVGDRLTETGVRQLFQRLGKAANIQGVRCSPHTARHYFAIEFLRAGRNLLELQALLGHEDLTVLQVYVKLAQVDLSEAHRAGSPADRHKLT